MTWFCNRLSVDDNTAPAFFGLYTFPNGVSDDEIKRLRTIIEKYPEQDGFEEGADRHGGRMARMRWVNNEDAELNWFIDRLQTMVQQANTAMRWGFFLDGLYENFCYTRYENESGDYFDGCCDVGKTAATASRKLTVHIQLTDPTTYQGGDFELYNVGLAPKQKGAVVIFPSFLLHRMTPVTRGMCEVLNLWISGPPFR